MYSSTYSYLEICMVELVWGILEGSQLGSRFVETVNLYGPGAVLFNVQPAAINTRTLSNAKKKKQRKAEIFVVLWLFVGFSADTLL